jgi:CNT family concentrative nucleoside transporter
MRTLTGLAGIGLLLFIAWLLSTDRKAINRRTILLAFTLQVAIAALILYVPFGRDLLGGVVRGVQHVIDYGNAGIEFVFGTRTYESLGFTIALNVLPVIVFFSALMSVH